MNRKYNHRGYQDVDRDREQDRGKPRTPRQDNLTKEERIQQRSVRRHSIDRDANAVLRCHHCGRNVQSENGITKDANCPHCASPLHCCRTCTHFDSSARWQCRAEIEKSVGDKNKANDCGLYAARMVLDVTGRRTAKKVSGGSNDPKSAFENLFKR